jgi:hypothetical protein
MEALPTICLSGSKSCSGALGVVVLNGIAWSLIHVVTASVLDGGGAWLQPIRPALKLRRMSRQKESDIRRRLLFTVHLQFC